MMINYLFMYVLLYIHVYGLVTCKIIIIHYIGFISWIYNIICTMYLTIITVIYILSSYKSHMAIYIYSHI